MFFVNLNMHPPPQPSDELPYVLLQYGYTLYGGPGSGIVKW